MEKYINKNFTWEILHGYNFETILAPKVLRIYFLFYFFQNKIHLYFNVREMKQFNKKSLIFLLIWITDLSIYLSIYHSLIIFVCLYVIVI